MPPIANGQRSNRRSDDGQTILTGTPRAHGPCADLELLVELSGLEPLTSCMPSGGRTSTRVHTRRLPSSRIPARPPASAPVAVLRCCTAVVPTRGTSCAPNEVLTSVDPVRHVTGAPFGVQPVKQAPEPGPRHSPAASPHSRSAAASWQRRLGWRRPGWPSASHGHERQVLRQQAGGDGAAAHWPPNSTWTLCRSAQMVGPAGWPARTVSVCGPRDHGHDPAGRHAGLDHRSRPPRSPAASSTPRPAETAGQQTASGRRRHWRRLPRQPVRCRRPLLNPQHHGL